MSHTTVITTVLQVVGVIACILTIHWAEHYKGGVVWGITDLGIAFNWHPVLMTVGLIFLYGNGEPFTPCVSIFTVLCVSS